MSIGWLTNITVEDIKFESTTEIKIVYKKEKIQTRKLDCLCAVYINLTDQIFGE